MKGVDRIGTQEQQKESSAIWSNRVGHVLEGARGSSSSSPAKVVTVERPIDVVSRRTRGQFSCVGLAGGEVGWLTTVGGDHSRSGGSPRWMAGVEGCVQDMVNSRTRGPQGLVETTRVSLAHRQETASLPKRKNTIWQKRAGLTRGSLCWRTVRGCSAQGSPVGCA